MEVALVYFAVLLIAFFMFIVRPQRRRMAAHRQFVAALRVGDEVVTTGGIFGTVRTLEDDRVELEVAPGVLVKLARAAVAQPAFAVAPREPNGTTPAGSIDGPTPEVRPDDGEER
ncbi:MAG TPA: preprotein translocase subunit YajC [Acidimicrobiia bacterium]